MKINLKELTYQINTLDMIADDIKNQRFIGTTGSTVKNLEAIVRLLIKIEQDLHIAGEFILELDKDRTAAAEEAYGKGSGK